MNKYASGYTAMSIISLVGWIVIGLSIICGFLVSMNREMGYIGLIIAVSGTVQGLILLGVGSIGSAILDGSTAQQEIIAEMRKNSDGGQKTENSNIEIIELMGRQLSAVLGYPGGRYIENYRGYDIIKNKEGLFLVNGNTLNSNVDARKYIDDESIKNAMSTFRIDQSGRLIVLGYRIPSYNGKFEVLGGDFDSPEEAVKYISNLIENGSSNKLNRYKM